MCCGVKAEAMITYSPTGAMIMNGDEMHIHIQSLTLYVFLEVGKPENIWSRGGHDVSRDQSIEIK